MEPHALIPPESSGEDRSGRLRLFSRILPSDQVALGYIQKWKPLTYPTRICTLDNCPGGETTSCSLNGPRAQTQRPKWPPMVRCLPGPRKDGHWGRDFLARLTAQGKLRPHRGSRASLPHKKLKLCAKRVAYLFRAFDA